MQRVFGIFFLLVLVYPFAGSYMALHVEKTRIRKAIKARMIAGIDHKDLVLVALTVAEADRELDWKHSREFAWRGNMYDIVKTEKRADSVLYWCWLDRAETKLNRQLRELVAGALGHSPTNRDNQKRLQHFEKTLFHSPVPAPDFALGNPPPMWVNLYTIVYYSRFITPPVPPPRVV